MKYTSFYASAGLGMDGWQGMLLGDEFPIGKVLPNWAPFPTGLVELGFSWRKGVL